MRQVLGCVLLGVLLSSATLAGGPRALYECGLEGAITVYTADFVERAVAEASSANAVALVVRLDTPGGLLAPTKRIVQSFLNAPLPIVVYVAPRGAAAASAGMLITLADPNVAYLTLMLGLGGILFEAFHPGLAVPGVAGVLSLACAIVGFKALPLSATGVLMLAIGLVFLVLELKTPSHGVLGAGGLASLAIGSYLLFDAPAQLRVSPEYIVAVVGSIGLVFLGLVTRVVADLRRPPVSGLEGMIGQAGQARDDFQDEGTVAIEGEVWKALNRGERKIAQGDQVRVLAVRDGRLEVERKD